MPEARLAIVHVSINRTSLGESGEEATTWRALSGLRSGALSREAEAFAGAGVASWRTRGVGPLRWNATCEGLWSPSDAARKVGVQAARAAFAAGEVVEVEIATGDGRVHTGEAAVSRCSLSGAYDGLYAYALELAGSGGLIVRESLRLRLSAASLGLSDGASVGTWADDSPQERDGTASGATYVSSDGEPYVTLSGSGSYVLLPDATVPGGARPVTVAGAWRLRDSRANHTLFAQGTNTDYTEIDLNVISGTLQAGGLAPISGVDLRGAPGPWFGAVLSYDGAGGLRLWLRVQNALYHSADTLSGVIAAEPTDAAVGREWTASGYDHYLYGDVRRVEAWDAALSDAEAIAVLSGYQSDGLLT